MDNTEATELGLSPASAMFAVARHMLDYTLPAPRGLYPPADGAPASVYVSPTDLDAWLEPMIVDTESTEPCADDLPALAGMRRVVFTGRIITAAHGAVDIQVRSLRQASALLTAVPA